MKPSKVRKIKLIISILCLGFIIGSCGKSSQTATEVENTGEEESTIEFSDLTEEDFKIVDSVNNNSDYEFILLDEMNVTEKEPDAPYTEETADGNVESYGFYVGEKHAVIRTQINLLGQSEYNILGIHNGDTYKEAIDKLEKEGFSLIESNPFGSDYTRTIFEKGVVKIRLRTKKINEESIDDDTIEIIGVSVPIVK